MDIYYANGEIRSNSGHEISSETFISKIRIYAYFALALAITGVIVLFYPYLLESFYEENIQAYTGLVYVSMVVPILFLLFCGIIMDISLTSSKIGRKPIFMAVMFLLYTIAMGMFLGTAFSFLIKEGGSDTTTVLSAAFIITGILFAFCGLTSKLIKYVNGLVMFLSSLIIGLIALILVNIFLNSTLVSWVVSIFLLIYILGVTAYDFHRINSIANRSTIFNRDALAIYCAFSIYTDFIFILIRVAIILLAFIRRD